MKKVLRTAFVAAVASTALVCVSCGNSYNAIKRMQKMEEGVSSPTTKEQLKEAIEKYDRRAIDLATTQAQEGVWYKILGTRYLDEQLYGKAYEAFQKALEFYPNNANLYYYLAVCAGYVSNSQIDWNIHNDGSVGEIKMQYLRVSEESFLRALAIDPKYYRAMYGLVCFMFFTWVNLKRRFHIWRPSLRPRLGTPMEDLYLRGPTMRILNLTRPLRCMTRL